MNLNIAVPDETALMTPVQRCIAAAEAMVIDSHEMKVVAADDLRSMQAQVKALEAQRTGIVGPLNEAVKKVNALFKPPAEALEGGMRVIKGKVLAYDREQERIAAEARRVAEEIARKERERLAAEAAKAQAKADEEARVLRERAAAAAAAGRVAEAAKLESKADSREEDGASKASELTMQAAAVTRVVAPVAPVKVAGLSTRKAWQVKVKDPIALISYVAANPAFQHFLTINETTLRQFAVSTKGAAQVPGVEFFEAEILSSRSAA